MGSSLTGRPNLEAYLPPKNMEMQSRPRITVFCCSFVHTLLLGHVPCAVVARVSSRTLPVTPPLLPDTNYSATPCRVFLAFSGYKRKVLLRREREATEATAEAARIASERHAAVGIDSERPVLSKDIASADGLWPVAPKHLEDIMDKFQSQRQAVLADLRSRIP